MAQLVDWENLEMCMMYWVVLRVVLVVPIVLRVVVER